jgi:hypothetical protein
MRAKQDKAGKADKRHGPLPVPARSLFFYTFFWCKMWLQFWFSQADGIYLGRPKIETYPNSLRELLSGAVERAFQLSVTIEFCLIH